MTNTYFAMIALSLCGTVTAMILFRALIDVALRQFAADRDDDG